MVAASRTRSGVARGFSSRIARAACKLFGQGRMLANHPPVDVGEVEPRLGEARIGAQIGREFAKALARHQPPVAARHQARDGERDREIADAAHREQ